MKHLTSSIIAFMVVIISGCSMISSNYIPSLQVRRPVVSPEAVQVYYDARDVPFKYKEIGRIFVKNINYWADRDPGGQISEIRKEAAQYGADAVIVVNGMRRESSFGAYTSLNNGAAGGATGDVFQYSGIAIIKEPEAPNFRVNEIRGVN